MTRIPHPHDGGNIDPTALFGALADSTDVLLEAGGFCAIDRTAEPPRVLGPAASLEELERLVAFCRRIGLTTHAPLSARQEPASSPPPVHRAELVGDVLEALAPLSASTSEELRRVLLEAFDADAIEREEVGQALMGCGLAIEEGDAL